jgi:putative membrane protein
MRRLLQKIALALIANSLTVWIVTSLLASRFMVTGDPYWSGVVWVGVTLGLLNTFIKPLLKVITLPFVLVTMGLFLVVINALLLVLLEYLFGNLLQATGANVEVFGGALSYFIVGFALAIINTLLHWLFKNK